MALIITGGKWQSQIIPTPKHNKIRPTTSRMRESIFSQMQCHLNGCRFMDGFSGTGIMSLEALSRGADFVLSNEKHRPQAHHLRNIRSQFKQDETHWHISALPFEKLISKGNSAQPFDWIYLDPPYPLITPQALNQWLPPLIKNNWLTTEPKGQLWLEHPTSFSPNQPTATRRYGDSTISQWTAEDLAKAYPSSP